MSDFKAENYFRLHAPNYWQFPSNWLNFPRCHSLPVSQTVWDRNWSIQIGLESFCGGCFWAEREDELRSNRQGVNSFKQKYALNANYLKVIKASIAKFLMLAEIFFIFDIILVSVFHLMSLIGEDGRDARPDSDLSVERKCSFHGVVNTRQDWYLKSHWYKGHIVIHESASGGSHRLQRGMMRWGTKKNTSNTISILFYSLYWDMMLLTSAILQ